MALPRSLPESKSLPTPDVRHLISRDTKNTVNRTMVPSKDAHVLIPRTYDHVPLHGKKAFPDVIQLRAVRWEKFLGVSRWVLVSKTWRRGLGVRIREREMNRLLLCL